MGQDQRPSRLYYILAAMGRPGGLFFANIAVLVFSTISGDQFLSWGWRVPFWLSIVMVAVGLYIRSASSRRRCSSASSTCSKRRARQSSR